MQAKSRSLQTYDRFQSHNDCKHSYTFIHQALTPTDVALQHSFPHFKPNGSESLSAKSVGVGNIEVLWLQFSKVHIFIMMRKDLHLAYSSPPNINIKVSTLPPSKLSKQDLIWIQIPTSHYGFHQLHVLLTEKTLRYFAKHTASMSEDRHRTPSRVWPINMNPVRHVWKKACVRQVNFNKLGTTTFKIW
jgi:hypothetical protein